MANPNNLIRPPINPINPNPPNPQIDNLAGNPALTNLISSIVSQTLRTEGRNLVYSVLNPNADQFAGIDQIINPDQRGNVNDLDKIPDVVRSLREFSGQPGEFSSWRKSVDRILKIYEHLRGSAKYYGIINVIRNKIVGHADHVLESYNIPLNWENISRCLTLHYADKRDLGTLEYQLTSLVQGNSSVQDFYQEVYSHLSLILNKISSMDASQEALNLLMHAYREKALDTFVRGLKGDLPRLLGIREPSDLPQALHLCLKLENQHFRTQYAAATNNNSKKQLPPPVPLRRPSNNYPQFQQQFYPALVQQPTNWTYPQGFNNFQPRPLVPQRPQQPSFGLSRPQLQNNRPQMQYAQRNQQPYVNPNRPQMQYVPKPQPPPVPMDTTTIRTNNINYMNQPLQKNWPPATKRAVAGPPSNQVHPNKLQRNFHLETMNEAKPEDSYEQNIQYEDQQYDQTLQEYTDSLPPEHENSLPQSNTDFSNEQYNMEYNDIHFLD